MRCLTVLNEDLVAPGTGFGRHPHQDMEIVTYMLAGELRHQDSTGGGSTLRAGEVQRMTAGRGIFHSEMNPSETEPAHLVQIWILPDQAGLDPGYQQVRLPEPAEPVCLQAAAGPAGSGAPVEIHQDAWIYRCLWREKGETSHQLAPGRAGYLQVLRGEVKVNGRRLGQGDAAELQQETQIRLQAPAGAEILLFDLK